MALFKSQGNTKQLLISIEELRDKAKDLDLKSNISNVLSLSEKKAKTFFQNLSIELDSSYIVERIKNKIREKMVDKPRIPAVFDSLISNLQEAKYLEILNRRKFELSFDEFQTKFGKCFLVGFDKKSLPKRQFNFLLPENIEEQIFIKQLIEIGDIENGASQIRDYTTQMLQTLNQFDDWSKNGFVLPT